MTKKASLAGMITCVLYFLSMGLILVAKTDRSLTIWEMMTVISGPVVLIVLIALAETVATPPNYQKAMIAFMSCACALTGAAHIINISVTRVLIRESQTDSTTKATIQYGSFVSEHRSYQTKMYPGVHFKCWEVCTAEDTTGLKRAFFEKEQNLKELKKDG